MAYRMFTFLFLIAALNGYTQKDFCSKIYINNNQCIIPLTYDTLKALVYYGDRSAKVNDRKLYNLDLEISNQFVRKIKYSVTRSNQFVAFTVPDTLVDRRPLVRSIAIDLDQRIDAWYNKAGKDFLKTKTATTFEFFSLSGIDATPIKKYFQPSYEVYEQGMFVNGKPPGKPISITYHDFSITLSEAIVVNAISRKLKVWRYDIKDKHLINDEIAAVLFKEYDWELDENFYICHLHGQLLFFTESGTIYRLDEQAEKIGQLSDNLIYSAIVVDNDHDKLYLLKKSYLDKKLPFNEMMSKYAKEVKIPKK